MAYGRPRANSSFHVLRLVGSFGGIDRHRVDVRRRLHPGILQDAALDGPAPQVIVDGVRRLLRGGNLDAVRLSPFHLLGAGVQIPFAHRGDNLDVRIKHEDARLEAHLVVALARAAVRDVLRAELVRRVHKVLGDQRPGQRGHERVLVLVQGVGGQRLGQEVLGEHVAHVHDQAFHGAGFQRLLLDLLKALMLLSHVADHGDNVEVLLLLEPLDAHGRIQSAGIRQHRFVLLLGLLSLLLSHGRVLPPCSVVVGMPGHGAAAKAPPPALAGR